MARITEITSLLYVGEQIWVGTTDGYLIMYHIEKCESTNADDNFIRCVLHNSCQHPILICQRCTRSQNIA